MFHHPHILQFLAVALTFSGLFAGMVRATIIPITSRVRSEATAQVGSNPAPPASIDDHSTPSGDVSASSHSYNEYPTPNPSLTCDVSSSATAHVDASGASGTASLSTTWVATNSLAPGSPNDFGTFDSTTFFTYSFSADTASTLSVDIATTSNVLGDPNLSPVVYAMYINHDFGFGTAVTKTYTPNFDLNGMYHYDIPVSAGFHELILEHHPNSGLGPWPAGSRTSDTNMAFSITPVPEPATALLLAVAAAPLMARRRRVVEV